MEIRANTILPARREDIELETDDGLTLVGELALPSDKDPVATLVTLHPLPTGGGFMDSHVYKKAAFRLPALADLAVLRFNTRGTCSPRGCSQGQFDGGRAERFDVEAALRFVRDRGLPDPWIVGWSFGTELALKYGRQAGVRGLVLLSPPLRTVTARDLEEWAADGRPVKVLVPEHDDYLQPPEARGRFAPLTQAEVVGVDGAKHLWVGEKHAYRALNEVVGLVNPSAAPLPHQWEGEFETEAPARGPVTNGPAGERRPPATEASGRPPRGWL